MGQFEEPSEAMQAEMHALLALYPKAATAAVWSAFQTPSVRTWVDAVRRGTVTNDGTDIGEFDIWNPVRRINKEEAGPFTPYDQQTAHPSPQTIVAAIWAELKRESGADEPTYRNYFESAVDMALAAEVWQAPKWGSDECTRMCEHSLKVLAGSDYYLELIPEGTPGVPEGKWGVMAKTDIAESYVFGSREDAECFMDASLGMEVYDIRDDWDLILEARGPEGVLLRFGTVIGLQEYWTASGFADGKPFAFTEEKGVNSSPARRDAIRRDVWDRMAEKVGPGAVLVVDPAEIRLDEEFDRLTGDL